MTRRPVPADLAAKRDTGRTLFLRRARSDLLAHPIRILQALVALAWTGMLSSVALLSVTLGSWAGEHTLPRVWARVVLWIYEIRVSVSGHDHVDPSAEYVFVANHRSVIDSVILVSQLRRMPRFVAKYEVARLPLLGPTIRALGHILIDRADPAGTQRTLAQAAATLGQTRSVVFWPEGKRLTASPARVGEFKNGAFAYAREVGLPIVPVALVGAAEIWQPGTLALRGGTMRVEFGNPLESRSISVAELNERARQWIQSRLAPWGEPLYAKIAAFATPGQRGLDAPPCC